MTTSLRIVSLVPSLTELVCELGLRDALVGRTGFCIHPRDSLREVPKVGGTKDVLIERVRRLAPTHLLVNVDENEKQTVEQLARFVPEVVVTHPIEVEDNRALIERFGRLFGRDEQALELCRRFDAELAGLRASRFESIAVAYLIWRDPWMVVSADTFIANMLAEAGMLVLAPSGVRYPPVDDVWLAHCAASVFLLSSEPYHFTEADAHGLQQALPADATGVCTTIDGEMTSWYGSRAIDGLRYLKRFRQDLDQRIMGAGAQR